MAGPKLYTFDGVPYISVGDIIALARLAHRRGATCEQLANALADILPKPKPPKKKEKKNVRSKPRT